MLAIRGPHELRGLLDIQDAFGLPRPIPLQVVSGEECDTFMAPPPGLDEVGLWMNLESCLTQLPEDPPHIWEQFLEHFRVFWCFTIMVGASIITGYGLVAYTGLAVPNEYLRVLPFIILSILISTNQY